MCAHCLKKEDRQNYVAVQAVKASVIVTKIVSEYDQEIPQSQTADNPVAPTSCGVGKYSIDYSLCYIVQYIGVGDFKCLEHFIHYSPFYRFIPGASISQPRNSMR